MLYLLLTFTIANAHTFLHSDGSAPTIDASDNELYRKQEQRHFLCNVANTIGKSVCENVDWKDENPTAFSDSCHSAVAEFNNVAELVGHEARLELLCEFEQEFSFMCLSAITDDDLDTCEWAWNHFEVKHQERRTLNCGCFMGEANVVSKQRGVLPMKDLEMGEEIQDCSGGFNRVWGVVNRPNEYGVKFTLEDGDELTLTQNHYVVTKAGNILARDVTVGDEFVIGGRVMNITETPSMPTFNVYAEMPYFMVNGVCATWLVEGHEFVFTVSPGASFIVNYLCPHWWVAFISVFTKTSLNLLVFTPIPQPLCFQAVCLAATLLGLLPSYLLFLATRHSLKSM